VKTGSMKDYAAHRGVSGAYVNKLKKQGRLVLVQVDGRTLVNFDHSDRLIDNTADQSRAGSGRNSPSQRPEAAPPASNEAEGEANPPPAPGSGSMPNGGPATDVMFRRAQTQEKILAAKTADVMYRRLLNESLERSVVERAVFDAFRSLRDHAFQAPQRAALRAHALTDVREIERVMAEELRKAFDGWEARMAQRLPAKVAL
jgi:hypothetical protein